MLLLLAITSILLTIPAVQTKLGKSATNYLQEEFDVDINVEKVDLSFLGSVYLKNIFIRDHHADSLIYIDNLSTSILSYRNILNNKLEFGQISMRNFKLNIKTYKGEVDDALTVFADKFDDGSRLEKPSGFLLTSSKLNLKKGYIEIIDENRGNNRPVFYKDIIGEVEDFKIQGPNVYANIRGFSFVENHDIYIKSLTTDFSYTKKFMKFHNTTLKTETSKINAEIEFNYKREDFSDFNNKVNLNAVINNADLSLIDLNKFYNEIGLEDVLHFSGTISGVLNDFNFKTLNLKSDQNAIVNGDLNFKNSFNTENGFEMKGYLSKLTSDYYHLKKMLPNILGNTLPSSFKKLGRFSIAGDTYIAQDKINAQCTITTDIGTAITDLELSNIANIDKASYKGKVEIVELQLGEIINNSLFGKISVVADVDGRGFTLEDLNTTVNGQVSSYQYKNYTYKNIDVNGVVKNKHFNGELEVNDNNIKLNFNGLADLSAEINTFDFNTVVDYCDLKAIKLFQRDSISNLKGEIGIKVKGNSLDDLEGSIDFRNSSYSNHLDDYFFKDFNVTSSFKDSIRTITINSSEIINGRVRGKFKIDELGKLAQNSIGSIYSNYKPFEVTSNQNLDFRFKIYNKIVEVFYPEVILGANTTIKGDINSNNNLFKLNIKSPQIDVYNTNIDEINLQIDNKNPLFNTQLTVDKITSNYYNISKFHLVNVTLNDTLYFRSEFKGGINNTEDYNLSFYHTFNKEKKSVFGIQSSNFTFKNNNWEINPLNNSKNKIVFDNAKKTYDFDTFLISSKDQKIEFSGVVYDTVSKDLNFKFTNVKLENITPKIDSLNLQGLINGSINYNQQIKKIKPTANLSVSNFYINNSKQGDLEVKIEGDNSITKYGLDVVLVRDNFITFSAKGILDFTPKKPILDIIVDFEEFKLDAFSPLGEDVFTNIRGFVYGNINFTGFINNPIMTGDLFLDKAGLYFPYINVDYQMEGTSIISLNKQTFNFEDVTLKDTKKSTKGSLTGTLTHSHFKTWGLNLDINTTNLLVLDTKETESSVYYGTGYLQGVANLYGPTDKLVIDVIGQTNKGTHLVIPISDVKTVEDSGLIRFINKGDVEDEIKRKAFISEKLKGLSLNFNIEVTKDAVVEMVLDKSTGSFLKGSGTGNMQIALDTKDKFDMYGDFLVDNGTYNFKYGGFINKPFDVKKGGIISWSGDPFTANIDIEAVYRVSANPRSLLENITANRKIPIDLITRFSGELFNSQREFDIEIPNSSSTVASELEFKLNNNDQNTKTIHFMALLATGSFYNESDLSVNTAGLAYGTATDLLSNAIENIFYQGDNRLKLRPVLTIGEKNKVDNFEINDQLGLALDYQVNDRILINGKVGVPIGTKERTGAVIGEVKIEYLMNDEGTLRSTLFNRQNEIQYTEEEEGYTQGIGLSYQIDFSNSKELLEKLGLRKKKIKELPQPVKKDSIEKNKLINFKRKKYE